MPKQRKSTSSRRMTPLAYRGKCFLTVPRSCRSPFPDRLTCWLTMESLSTQTATTGISLQWKLSDICNLMGPRSNYAGAFAANTPSGLVYLISSDLVSGSVAPYGRCLVTDAQVEVRCLNTVTTNAVPTQLSLQFDKIVDATSGMSITQLAEQQYAKTSIVPTTLTVDAPVLSSTIHLPTFFGVDDGFYRNSAVDYGTAPGISPSLIAYASVCTRTLDGTTVASLTTIVKIHVKCEFSNRNTMSTTVPA
jgi:hypothetical protein